MVAILLCGLALPAAAQGLASPAELPEAPAPQLLAAGSSSSSQAPSSPATAAQATHGSLRGTVLDRDGASLPGAHVTLTRDPAASSPSLSAITAPDGSFAFDNLTAGPVNLTVIATGFSTQVTSAVVQAGPPEQLSPISLHPGVATDVEVTLTRTEIAQDQIHLQEQQRVLGAIPNYYVSYTPNALPLTPRQKFELAWKTSIDPVTFGVTGIISAIQQADDDYAGYDQGAKGYGRRYGANYADFVSGTFLGGAVLPTLLHQDPRYFYKGTGSIRFRIGYAIAMSVICKGDNGRWQPNYSGILGSLAAGGISNLYYPDTDRNGAGLTFRNAAIGTGTTAIGNLFQEFLVRRLTPHARKPPPAPVTPLAPPAPAVPPPAAP